MRTGSLKHIPLDIFGAPSTKFFDRSDDESLSVHSMF